MSLLPRLTLLLTTMLGCAEPNGRVTGFQLLKTDDNVQNTPLRPGLHAARSANRNLKKNGKPKIKHLVVVLMGEHTVLA